MVHGKKIRLGVIGVGNMGSAHIRSIRDGMCPEIEVAAAADRDPQRLEWIREQLPEVRLFETAEAMLDSGLLDAALIAVPHYAHPQYAIDCFQRDIHVMVEKPAGVYVKQVQEMNAAAEQSHCIFGIMLNQRTDHIYRKMKEITDSGRMGALRRSNWIITDWYRPQAYYNSGQWRATWSGEGGGVLLNQCPHNLDLWQWICGMPVKVQSHMYFGKWHDIEVEDDVTTYVEYANGATGTFITTTGDVPGSNRFELTFEKGKLIATPGKLELWELEVPEPKWSRSNAEPFGQPKHTYSVVETDGRSEQHCGVLNAFAAAILRGEPLVAQGREGIYGLTLSNAMHLSAWTGTAVSLPLDHELYYQELMKRVASSRRKELVQQRIADTSGSYGIS